MEEEVHGIQFRERVATVSEHHIQFSIGQIWWLDINGHLMLYGSINLKLHSMYIS